MFVIDIDTLHFVNALYFLDQVLVHSVESFDPQNIVRIERPLGDPVSSLRETADFHLQTCSVRNIVFSDLSVFFGSDHDLCRIVIENFDRRNRSALFADFRQSLWFTSFKKLFDPRKTLRDITARNAAGVERTHGQLCTWFTDRLRSRNSDCFSDLNRLSRCQTSAVTFAAYSGLTLTGEYRTDPYLLDSGIFDFLRLFIGDFFIFRNKNPAGRRIQNIFRRGSARKTLPERFNFFFSFHEGADINAFFRSAVFFSHDDIMTDIYQTPGQIS